MSEVEGYFNQNYMNLTGRLAQVRHLGGNAYLAQDSATGRFIEFEIRAGSSGMSLLGATEAAARGLARA